jgi:21S rRNA (uridine2791-2'-O)-methyltransferase
MTSLRLFFWLRSLLGLGLCTRKLVTGLAFVSSYLSGGSHITQVAAERTKPNGRIVGIDIIPAQPPKGVSTIQGNFLSAGVQDEVKRFLSDLDRGRPKQQFFSTQDTGVTEAAIEQDRSYIDLERHADDPPETAVDSGPKKRGKKANDDPGKMVDVVLSDMSAPWEQTTGFWKKSLSNPYRMMNTSGIPFKDHAGSMVC